MPLSTRQVRILGGSIPTVHSNRLAVDLVLGRCIVADTEEFLASMLPRMTAADAAIHAGDAGPRKALWSRQTPLTLFGAAMMTTGWPEINATFDWLAATFSNCTAFEIEIEVVAAAAGGDLAYLVAIEHTTASIGGAPAPPYSLRVTTIFRREEGEWKIVHRHADPLPDSAAVKHRLTTLLSADSGLSNSPS